MTAITPSHSRPPIVEMVLGLHFKPVNGLDIGHLVAFAQGLQSQYPRMAMGPALPILLDFVPSSRDIAGMEVPVSMAGGRFTLTSKSGASMVQIQNGRLCCNWHVADISTYPGFTAALSTFTERLGELRAYILANFGVEIAPQITEVGYVDHFAVGEWWQELDELYDLLPGIMGSRLSKHPLDNIERTTAFRVGQSMRIDTNLTMQRRVKDWAEVAVLNIGALCQAKTMAKVAEMMNVGHTEIMSIFGASVAPRVLTACKGVDSHAS